MVIAKQVPPEHQCSPFEFEVGDFEFHYPGVILTGNKNFVEHITNEYNYAVNNLYDAQQAIYELGEDCPEYEDEAEVITEFFPPVNKDEYSRDDIEHWIRLLVATNNSFDKGYIVEALSLMTGCKYEYTTIRGCCQSDWQQMFYPADQYSSDFVEYFSIIYFNLGSEWTINDECFYLNTSGYDMDEVRNELCEQTGLMPDEIKLLKFEGWKKTATYEEVCFND